jgi:putative transcriptional regulator
MRFAAIVIFMRIALGQRIEASPAKGVDVGTLLIATRKSTDADLKQSVVLIVHNGPEGAIGLIVNHPISGSRYLGGPIPIGIRTLIRAGTAPEQAEPILKGVYMVPRRLSNNTARVFAGYVGWSPRQLKDEIARALWTFRKGDASMVFDAHPDTLWQRLAR